MAFYVVAAIAASTAVSAYGQIEAGKAQEDAAKREAELQKMPFKYPLAQAEPFLFLQYQLVQLDDK